MIYAYADAAASWDIALPFPADPDTVTWRLRGPDGTQLTAGSVTNPQGAFEVTINVSADYHAKTGATENRFLEVSWISDGAHRMQPLNYVVIDWVPIMATEEDVRTTIGLSSVEVKPSEIDILTAYLLVAEDVGLDTLRAGLSGAGVASLRANQMLTYRAIIELLPSLRLRLAQIMESDKARFQRFRIPDMNAFLDGFRQEYDRLRQLFLGEELVPPTIFTLSAAGTDPVTG